MKKKSTTGTTGVINKYGPGFKPAQNPKSATGRPAPAMKKGGSVKSKK